MENGEWKIEGEDWILEIISNYVAELSSLLK